MFTRRVTTGAFVLEGLNAVSTTFYFYFIYWFLKSEYQFGSRENLLWAVGSGVVYVVASLQGGRYGQRRGYLRAMRMGFAGMSACFLLGWLVNLAGPPRPLEITLEVLLMLLATVSICFTWPNLEAVASEGAPPGRLQKYVGIYNLVWSGAGAVAYFSGGALIERLGPRTVILLIPAVMIAGQYAYAIWLERAAAADAAGAGASGSPQPHSHGHSHSHSHSHPPLASEAERHRDVISPRTFLRMSWLANPCAYVAVAAAIPLIPTLADRLGLGPASAGFFCSIWLFARTATFVALWRWTGWHYRFRWLATAFVGTILGFLFIFLGAAFPDLDRTQALLVVTVSQVVFGMGLGLIYYSSLFYSMDVGDTKGDHGGIHEAALGVGILGGPLVGAAAQFIRPGSVTAPAWAVSVVLAVGLAVLFGMRFRRR